MIKINPIDCRRASVYLAAVAADRSGSASADERLGRPFKNATSRPSRTLTREEQDWIDKPLIDKLQGDPDGNPAPSTEPEPK